MYIFIAANGELSLQEHYWLDADVVLDVSGRGDDQQWVEQFWEMLTKVEAYGYSDMTNKRVKAHLDQT
jgi:hypothetical protein